MARSPQIRMPSDVLNPMTFARGGCGSSDGVALRMSTITPTGLPMLAPAALVPMKFPSTTFWLPLRPVRCHAVRVLKPMTFAAPEVIPPMVLFGVPTATPNPLPRLAPLASVPMKFPMIKLLFSGSGASCEHGNRNAVPCVGAEDIALIRCQPADRVIRRLDGDSVATSCLLSHH